jgi:alpha-1,2-glucosyltransferase
LTLPIIFSSFRRIWTKPPSPSLLIAHAALLALGTIFALIAIRYNTIIHPFTLADNRHYTFYIFKILRQYPLLKYLAAPLYIICASLVIYTLGTLTDQPTPSTSSGENSIRSISTKTKAQTADDTTLAWVSPFGCRVSFVMVWLATTTLSLVSAPLVEPRYCILPWLFWRLHVPSIQPSESRDSPPKVENDTTKGVTKNDWFWAVICREDVRIWVETAWFTLINLVTGYVFLYRGFEWASEPGKVQRFMW